MKHDMTMAALKRPFVCLASVAVMVVVLGGTVHAVRAVARSGHDHGVHATLQAGHAEAEDHTGADHDGHDHAVEKHARASEEHDGHDHAVEKHARASEEHDGHGHGLDVDGHAQDEDHVTEGDTEARHGDDGHRDDETDSHAGHAHEGGGLQLSSAEVAHAGIVTAVAGPGRLEQEVRMSGETVLNEDALAHVAPLVTGVTAEVHRTVGDRVEAGELLAVIDSAEFGEAKLAYLTALNEIGCCRIVVPRVEAIHDSTSRLLAFLAEEPSLDALQGFDAGEVGENLSRLIGDYADMYVARQTWARERGLRERGIASEEEYLAAKTASERASATYKATHDSIRFDIRLQLSEARAKQRNAEFAVHTAERRLRLMGASENSIVQLQSLVPGGVACDCGEAACTGCGSAATAAPDKTSFFREHFTRYEVRSPISGVVVDRHVVRGEIVSSDSEVFAVANTDEVWVHLTVHLRDIEAVAIGQEVTIRAEHSGRRTRGRISMLSPVVDRDTRTAEARVVIDNAAGDWPPGVFVVGIVTVDAADVPVVVPRHAVQNIDGETVVFTGRDNVFEAVPVRTGRSDRERVEIVSGLAPGTAYVAEGAFELKAKLVTSTLDPHAGHGH